MRKGHLLPLVEVNDCKGRILDGFGHFTDLPRYEARVKMMDYLTNVSLPLPLPSLTEHLPLLLSQMEKGARGFFSHSMVLPVCSRSKVILELLLRPQWFVQCQAMAKRAVEAVKSCQLEIIPDHLVSLAGKLPRLVHFWSTLKLVKKAKSSLRMHATYGAR